MRTLIYLRVSTDAQEREGTSLDTQERASIEYVQAKGWTVTRIIRDVASGASLDRPGIEEVRRALRDGACDVLLAHAVDRLAREPMHLGVLFYEAEQADVNVDCVSEEIEDSPIGRFVLSARALAAAIEREKIIERTARGKKERARTGRLPQGTGIGCFGYTYVLGTGRRVLNPEQAPIVVRIFEEFVAGKSCNRIANDLNADDIPTFTGRRWHPITARRVLDNETYTGRTVFGRTRVEMTRHPGKRRRSRRVVERDESEHIEIPGASAADHLAGTLQQGSGASRAACAEGTVTQLPAWRQDPLPSLRCRHGGAAPRTTGGTRTTAATASTSRRRTSAAIPARFAPRSSRRACAIGSRSSSPTRRW